ncbi:glycosyltransferase involved in cell wall biosynthesis [Paenarthrobacter nitroguajacolicus]|uniref:glycosyltransferase family 2 protein n=1 Tax=Paenarthrobacter TaxID=1742992 RepID=UPI00285A3654|nr:glycosyltransferase family 2 protein [Paenarthrobacter nitroguajacolicus]MDR6987270.1 glycosyltransferase involved in cell wall biosynthesis [Paenarthrobacter nitroguajacolicus]
MRPIPLLHPASVSVVVPCYNYGHYLPEAVASALSQDGVDVEVIVVDDASTDGSAAVAWRLASEDPRITVVLHESNQGHIATYNDGLSRARGRYVTLLSADDVIAPGALSRAAALMEANPRVGMVYGLPRDFTERPPAVPLHERTTWTVWEGKAWVSLACARGRNFILSPEVVMRTAAVLSVGAYSTMLPHSGDLEYWLRAAGSWDVGRINGPVQAFYRVHGANMHQTEFAAAAVDLKHRLEAFRVLEDPRFPTSPKIRARQLQRAKCALSKEAAHLGFKEINGGGSVEAAVELRKFIECLHEVPGNVHRANALQARIIRANRGHKPGAVRLASGYVRSQLDRVRWRIWAMTGIS